MYEPEVDDYVIWDQGEYGKHEGWVYFKCDPVDNEKRVKNGWNPVPRYITIEIGTKPKPYCEYSKNADQNHKMIHILLLCYDTEWKNLKFIKKRKSKNDNTIIQWAKDNQSDVEQGRREFYSKNKEQFMLDMYKSQHDRYLDVQ